MEDLTQKARTVRGELKYMRQEATETGYRAYFSHDKLVVINNEGKRNSYPYNLDEGILKCVLENFKDNAS